MGNCLHHLSFRDTHLCVGPESILPVVVMDSGLALRAPRNDVFDFCHRVTRIARRFIRTPALETQIRHKIPALVLDRVGTFQALERLLGVFIAKRRGPLVIGFGGG
jgi:hypothetical protein